MFIGSTDLLNVEDGQGGRFSQTTLQEPGFNSHPSHPLEGAASRRSGEARDLRSHVGPESPDAPPAAADPVHEGPGQATQARTLPEASLRLRRQGPMRGPLHPDEEAHRRRRLPSRRGLAPPGGPEAPGEPTLRSDGPYPGRLLRRHGLSGMEQQGPTRQQQGPRRPRGQGRQRKAGLLPGIRVALPNGRRGLPAGSRGGFGERE